MKLRIYADPTANLRSLKPYTRSYLTRLDQVWSSKLTQQSDFWWVTIALIMIPLLELRAAMSLASSPPTILSALWLLFELSHVFNSSSKAHFKRRDGSDRRLLVAFVFWVSCDLPYVMNLAPWILTKLALGYLVAVSLARAHHTAPRFNPDRRSYALGVRLITLMSGLSCSLSALYFWYEDVALTHNALATFGVVFLISQASHFILSLLSLRYVTPSLERGAVSTTQGQISKRGLPSPYAPELHEILALREQRDRSYVASARRDLKVHLGVAALQLFTCFIVIVYYDHLDASLATLVTSLITLAYTLLSVMKLGDLFRDRYLERLERALSTPWRALSLSMFALCGLGTALLAFPGVELNGRGLSLIEATFTSVSASCITGLSVIDLSQLNFLGQLIILVLIQVGGFGIILITHMTLSLWDRGNKGHNDLNFTHLTRSMFGETYSELSYARQLALFVLGVELFAATALSVFFLDQGYPLSEALWRGIFTSISAFCNAGFALHSDSFMSYAGHAPVLVIISLTVLLGGIGPRVILELIHRWRAPRTGVKLSLYSRVILYANLILVIIPTLFFFWVEWGSALAHLAPQDKLVNALFHTTSLRTAGFNSFDLAMLQDPSWSLSLVLMIIGGSPFSTAGGIKVTTFVLVFVALIPTLRGERVLLSERSQSLKQGAKALSTLFLSLVCVGAAIFFMQCLGEPLSMRVMIFEVVSALGTVGLSMGGTGLLNTGGLALCMLCMFLGRIGPPALLLSLQRAKPDAVVSSYIDDDLPLS